MKSPIYLLGLLVSLFVVNLDAHAFSLRPISNEEAIQISLESEELQDLLIQNPFLKNMVMTKESAERIGQDIIVRLSYESKSSAPPCTIVAAIHFKIATVSSMELYCAQ